jgi:signal transduction histidine kinase
MDGWNIMTEQELSKCLEVYSHKLKNPLHSITLNLEALRISLKDDPELLKLLGLAESQTRRMTVITERFIKYLNKKESEREMINLKNYLDGADE